MSRESIHKKFLAEVKRLGLDVLQKDFAAKMKVGEPIISMYLNSKRNVSRDFLRRFCEEYNLDYDEMIKEGGGGQSKLTDRDLIAMFLQVSGTQTLILQDIQKNMARADGQAEIRDQNKNLMEALDFGFGLVSELVDRDVRREAGDNLGKVDETLDAIARKNGPDLWAKLKGSSAAGTDR